MEFFISKKHVIVKMATGESQKLSDEVQYIELYKYLPVFLHGYVTPFIIIYLFFFTLWIFVFGLFNYFEMGCIIMAICGISQVLVCLACHWSVHAAAWLTCKKVLNYFLTKRYQLICLADILRDLKKSLNFHLNQKTKWSKFSLSCCWMSKDKKKSCVWNLHGVAAWFFIGFGISKGCEM